MFAAKLGAAAVGVVSLAVAYSLVHLSALWVLASTRGEVGDLTPDWWAYNLGLAGRLLMLVFLTTVCAGSLTMIGRRTVAAIGIAIGYGIVVEFGLRFLLSSVNIDTSMFTLSTYVGALFGSGFIADDSLTSSGLVMAGWTGGVVLVGVTAALVALSGYVFRRRDTV